MIPNFLYDSNDSFSNPFKGNEYSYYSLNPLFNYLEEQSVLMLIAASGWRFVYLTYRHDTPWPDPLPSTN